MPRKAKEEKIVEKTSTKSPKVAKKEATKKESTKTVKKETIKKTAKAEKKVVKEAKKTVKSVEKKVNKKEVAKTEPTVKDNRADKQKPIGANNKTPERKVKMEELDLKLNNNGPKKYTTIGDYSNEIVQKHMAKKSNEELEYEDFKKLENAYYTKQLLWGTIYGVEPVKMGDKNSFVICLLWNNHVKIMIPDSEYWLENMYFSKSYYNKTKVENGRTISRPSTEEEKTNIRMAIARNYIGAQICFILSGRPVRQKIENNELFEGEYTTYAAASRLEAIKILRDKYFFHRNHKSDKEPITIKKNDIVEAHVIGVKEDMVLVEALGVETRLDCYSLTDDYITDCHQKVKPGDDIDCKVVNVEIQDNNIKLVLSGRTKDASKAILFMRKNAWYNGKVIYFNEQTQNYTIYLDNGVRASVNKDRVEGYFDLSYGDIVTVHVLKMYPDHVAGNCVKLRG